MSATPAQLALELGVTDRAVRGFLREQYGRLPDDVTRWNLDDAQEAAVRLRFGVSEADAGWLLEPGARLLRSDLHATYRGNPQSGIVPLVGRPDILIFTSPPSGSHYGYDEFEGLQPDGSFHYTGEGRRGDQVFKRGNLALRDSGPKGRPIRLFSADGVWVTYVGEFATGDPTYRIETIPDVDGVPRNGIIFTLVPVDADTARLASRHDGPDVLVAVWSPPDSSDVVIAGVEQPVADRVVTRIEFALQSDFGEWLQARGEGPSRLLLTVDGTTIEPDLYVETTGWVVEAKRSSSRGYVREALGQVLDYANVVEESGRVAVPVILLPGRPAEELVRLLGRHGVTLAVRDGSSFEVISPNS
ncbi:hypothetical protein [Schumannella luteola]